MSKVFGEAIRDAREAQGISIRALADRVGVDFTYISKIENDQMDAPSDGVIVRMAAALNIWPDGLLNLSAKAPREWRGLLEGNPRLVQILRCLAKKRYTDEEYQAIFEIIRDNGVSTHNSEA